MNRPFSPSSWPVSDPAVREALLRAWEDGSWGRYHGPHCERLAAELAARHGVEHALLCCSGTFAVELALRSLKVAAGDEVILAGYDFPGNFRAIEAIGALPVLVDLQPGDWIADLTEIAAAIGPQTRAILVSHLHGSLIDMPAVMGLAAEHGVSVVEDACQAHGARVAGRVAGSWGDVGVLSFGGSKLLTAGRGGAILTRSADCAQRARIFGDRGNQAFPMSELQAAVLLPQLEVLDERNQIRHARVQQLLGQLSEVAALRRPGQSLADSRPSFYKLAWRYEGQSPDDLPIDELVAEMQGRGVPIDRGFRGFTHRSQRRCRSLGALPESQRAANSTLILHHPVLLESSDHIDQLGEQIKAVVNQRTP